MRRYFKPVILAGANLIVLAFGAILFLNEAPIERLLRAIIVMLIVLNVGIFSIVKIKSSVGASTNKVVFGAWFMVIQLIRILGRERSLLSFTSVDIASLLFFIVGGCYYVVTGTREEQKARAETSHRNATLSEPGTGDGKAK